MLSRVYTPPVTPYRSQLSGSVTRTDADDDVTSGQTAAQSGITAESNDTRQSSRGLKSVQYDRSQKIPLDSVLSDFQNTMNALGADAQTQAEVSSYLNIVNLQGSKDQPEVPFMKHTLKTAAVTLDQYISNALGQPSTVVKEWVDALLMQNIDFKTDKATADILKQTTPNTTPVENTTKTPTVAATYDKAAVKTLVQNAVSAQKSGDASGADTHLSAALDALNGTDQPALEGKIWKLRGKNADTQGDWETAVTHYQTAAERFEQAGLTDKQADALNASGSVLEDHGQLQDAYGAYQGGLALDSASTADDAARRQLRSLNDAGRVAIRLSQTSDAITHLRTAATLAKSTDVPADVSSDILSNLGAAYRQGNQLPQAAAAYRQAAQAARTAQDKPAYIQSLQRYAAVLSDAGQTDQAIQALQRISILTSQRA